MLAEQAPEHRVVVARELTKKFEEFQRGPARIVLSHYQTKPPKGEMRRLSPISSWVLVIYRVAMPSGPRGR